MSDLFRTFVPTKKAPVMGCDHSEAKVGLTRPRLHKMCFKNRKYFLVFQTYLV